MKQTEEEILKEKTNKFFKINSPKVLIIIFETNESNNKKIKIKEQLDITTYTSFEKQKDKKINYNLYGVVSKIKNENYFIASCCDYDKKIWYKYDEENKNSNKIIADLKNEVLDDNNKIPLILFYYLED